MTITTLRKSGGSHIVTVPNAFVEQNRLSAGALLELNIAGKTLTVKPSRRSRHTLAELLRNTPENAAVTGWDESARTGNELL